MRLRFWSSFAPSLSRVPPRRRPASALLFLIAAWLTTGLVPARAAVSPTDGLYMADACGGNATQFNTGEYAQAIFVMNIAIIEGDTAAAEFQAAVDSLRRCMSQSRIARVLLDARRDCASLTGVHLRLEQVIQISEAQGIPVSRTSLQGALEPDILKCWDELTSRCLDMSNRSQVQLVSDILDVARWAFIPRSYLVPPLVSCSKTVPACRSNEAAETCTPYLLAAANILFGGRPLDGILPQ